MIQLSTAPLVPADARTISRSQEAVWSKLTSLSLSTLFLSVGVD